VSLYTDFLPEVMPYVPDCPEAVAVNAIRSATIEFCRKSLWLIYTHDPITTVAGSGEYELDLPEDTELAMILAASYGTLPLKPVGSAEVATIMKPLLGQTRYYTQIDSYNVELIAVPQDSGIQLQMLLAITPTRASMACDDALAERWAERIGYGARARLYEIPGQTFSNPDMAMKYASRFHTGIGEAIVERNRGLTRATLRVVPPRFV
jgi:hypothetical protein